MQVRLAEQGGCVLGSRLAIWLLRDTAFSVYLRAPLEIRAGRIARRESTDPAATLAETDERDRRDRDRYSRLYGYDIDKFGFAALVVDTASMSQEEVAEEIVAHAAEMPGAGSPRSRTP